jgi:chemotaxis protein MotB
MKWSTLDSDEQSQDQWITSYADLISALLAVLILLASFSKVDIEKYDAVQRSQTQVESKSLKQIYDELKTIAKAHQLEEKLEMEIGREGLEIKFNAVMLFKGGDSQLDNRFFGQLKPVLEVVARAGEERYIDVIGHTDDKRYRNPSRRETNWTLSAKRAASLHQYLLDQGMPKQGTRLIAYADTKPDIPIDGLDKAAAEAARKQNRRVSVVIGLLK